MRHRVLCFGGRTFADAAAVDRVLSQLTPHPEFIQFAIIQGGARGADTLCAAWGKTHGHPVIEVAAPWETHGKRAGPLRNSWMIELCQPTYAVGFPGGPGSANMASQCRAAGVPLWLPFGP